jgi:hypothetical protein
MNVTKVLTKEYENKRLFRRAENKPKQTQFHSPFRALSPSTNPQLLNPIHQIFPAQRQSISPNFPAKITASISTTNPLFLLITNRPYPVLSSFFAFSAIKSLYSASK